MVSTVACMHLIPFCSFFDLTDYNIASYIYLHQKGIVFFITVDINHYNIIIAVISCINFTIFFTYSIIL